MLAFWQTMISFGALVTLCAWLARTATLPSGLAPLPVCCGVMALLVFGGYLNLLEQTGWLVLLLAAAALVHMVLTRKRGGFRALLTPGLVLFCMAGAAFILFLAIRQPIAQEWDEFSLWAPAARLTVDYNEIYTQAPNGWPWMSTQKPGLPTFSYFLNFFGEYAAWRMYAAYDVLLVAVWSAAIGSFTWAEWKLAMPTTLTMFLLHYFHVYARWIYCNFSYISAYADYPMGFVMCGLLAWYYHAKRAQGDAYSPPRFCLRVAGPLCAITAALTLCKDTGLPLACIAAGIIGADLLLPGGGEKPFSRGVVLPRLGLTAALFAAAGGTFLASSRYLASLGSAQGSVGGASDMSYGGMLVEGTKALLGLPPSEAGAAFSERFVSIRNEMITMFLPTADGISNVTMVGCGLFVMLLVWALVAVTAIFTRDKAIGKSAVLYGVLSTLGFFAYYCFIGFTYVYVFKSGIVDYNRYMNTYYLMWVGGAAVLLALGAARGSRFKNLLTPAVLGLSCLLLLRFTQVVQPQLSILDYPDAVYSDVNATHARAQSVAQHMESGSRVYYIHSNDNGLSWFRYHYALMPEQILQYSHGGAAFFDYTRTSVPDESALHISIEEFAAELLLQDCRYVFIDYASPEFIQGYNLLFADFGYTYLGEQTLLYEVNVSDVAPILEPLTADDVAHAWELNADGTVTPNTDGSPRMKLLNWQDVLTLSPVEMEVPAS